MLVLPILDVEALQTAGHEIGAWPELATGDFDGQLPPPMKLLLAGDPAAASAMERLGADFDFFDVDPDDAEQLAACAALARSIKELVEELAASDREAVRIRLQRALGGELSDAEAQLLIAGLSQDVVADAARDWGMLPDAASEDASAGNDATQPARFDPPSANYELRFDEAGRWTYDAATLSIRYRPIAHADPVLGSWLNVVAETHNLIQHSLPLAMFEALASPTAAGLCASCHSVEKTAGESLLVNWRAADRTHEPRSLTKFSHRPHLLLPQLADCTSCHAMDSAAATATAYTGYDPHHFVSDFSAMSKQQCAACHTAKAAGENCAQCHNYHVDRIESWRFESIEKDGHQDTKP